jgi:hypothetical protein
MDRELELGSHEKMNSIGSWLPDSGLGLQDSVLGCMPLNHGQAGPGHGPDMICRSRSPKPLWHVPMDKPGYIIVRANEMP